MKISKIFKFPYTSTLTVLLAMILTAPLQQVFASDEGMALAEKVYNRPAGKDAASQVVMTLKGKNRSERIRELSLFKLDQGKSERWTLMRFSKPADVRDTALLTKDHPGDDSDQWIYLPALDRVRIISSKRKGGKFVGSDFTYEDLRDREPHMDKHTIDGKAKVSGIETVKLVSIPVKKSNSIYSKRVSFIHEKSLTPLRVELYRKGKDKPYKIMKARKLKKIQGIWTVLESTMYDLKAGSQTRLFTTRIKYDVGLKEALFSKRGLSDSSMDPN